MTNTESTPEQSSPETTQTATIPDIAAPQPQPQPAQHVPTQQPQPSASGDYTPARPTNVLGIITLVLGILGFAIIPVITGHIALQQIRRTGDEGRGITLVGLVLGYIGLVGIVVAALIFFGVLFLGAVGVLGSGHYSR